VKTDLSSVKTVLSFLFCPQDNNTKIRIPRISKALILSK
jgi:hypothetical protein